MSGRIAFELAPFCFERISLQAPERVELLVRFVDPAQAPERGAEGVARLWQAGRQGDRGRSLFTFRDG